MKPVTIFEVKVGDRVVHESLSKADAVDQAQKLFKASGTIAEIFEYSAEPKDWTMVIDLPEAT